MFLLYPRYISRMIQLQNEFPRLYTNCQELETSTTMEQAYNDTKIILIEWVITKDWAARTSDGEWIQPTE